MYRNIIIAFLTSILTLSFMVFVSCAHSTPTEEDELAAAEEGSSDRASDEQLIDTEGGSKEKAATETPQAPEDLAASAKAPKAEEGIIEAGGDAVTEKKEEKAKVGSADEMSTDLESGAAVAPSPTPSAFPELSSDPSLTETPTTPVPVGDVALPSPPVYSVVFMGSKPPRIPKSALQRGKDSLNRFYFVRKGDTGPKLAELLLGNSSRENDLKHWNKGAWKPGALLFYGSVTDPSDRTMQSFYQERNVAPENYQIGKGDWLSKIAAKKYGSHRSWKEIAVLNGIRNPDSISMGQRIVLFPADLSGYSGANQFAQKTEPPPVAIDSGQQGGMVANNQPSTQAQPLESPPQVVLPPQEEIPSPQNAGAERKDAAVGGNLMGILEQNLLFIAVGAAIILLLVALIAVKKKKARALEESGEDPVAPPKARRS